MPPGETLPRSPHWPRTDKGHSPFRAYGYRHRSPGVVTYVFQRYPHGSTSGTITTPGKMPENESAMSGSSVWPRYGGSHAASTQMSFHVNSKISSGIILTGYRTPRRQSSVSAPKKLIPTPCQKSHGCV